MQKISISGPAELLAVLPFHLGFRPARSVVMVCFHGKRMGLVARLDACPPVHAHDVVDQILPSLRVEAPTHVMLVGYEDVVRETAPLSDALADRLPEEAIEVTERLVVRDGRWYGLDCTRACCPPEGRALPADADVPGVAGYVALGRSVLPGRESLTAMIEPLAASFDSDDPVASIRSQRAVDAVTEAIREFVGEVEWARRLLVEPPGRSFYPPGAAPVDNSEMVRVMDEAMEAWSRLLGGRGAGPSGQVLVEDLPALVGCLRDAGIRDGLIAWLCPGTLEPQALEPLLLEVMAAHLDPLGLPDEPGPRARLATSAPHGLTTEDVRARLEALCRLVPAEHAAPVLAVAASYAWWCGDGVRAGVALERALDLEPDHRLCALLRHMISLGIRTDRASA